MTSEEKQEIINAVLAAIRTNCKTIEQLTPVAEMSDDDYLELNGGRRVSYGVLFANHMSNEDAQTAWEYIDQRKVDKDSRGLVEVHQAPVVFLDAMGTLDGHVLGGSDGLEYRTNTKLIYDFPGGLLGAPKEGAVYISKNNLKKFVWNGTDMEELKVDECPLFVDYSEPVSFATLPIGGSYYVPSSHKIAVKIDASSTKAYDPLPDALYYFRDKGMIYTWNSSTNKWVPAGCDIKVINNLTAGGEEDALSAEQGKVLKGLIDNIGTGGVSAFSQYAVIASVAELPGNGNATTGYIVGTHIYAYVGTDGDTADGKYQDLGDIKGFVPSIDPATGKWVIGGVVTNYPSRGERGDAAPVPYIGENGNWWVGATDTNVKAQGPKGNSVADGDTFEIVNNLIDGGEEDALSAEQGKKLGDEVFDNAIEEVDVSAVALTSVYVNGSKWAVQAQGKYQGKFIDISKYRGWTFRIGNYLREYSNGTASRWWYRFALLTSNSYSNNANVPFSATSPYNALISVSSTDDANRWHEGVVPNDVTHIYVFTHNADETTCPNDFNPELFFIDPTPTSRIERLECIAEGVPSIKEDWFAKSGENQQYQVGPTDCWPNQTIGTNGTTYYGSTVAPDGRCYPKSASLTAAYAVASDCFKVADLPGKQLNLTFCSLESNWWAVAVAVFDSSLNLLYRNSPFVTVKAENNWQASFDLSTYAGATYFKLIIEQRNSNGSLDGSSYTPPANFLSFTIGTTSQESVPNRISALEQAMADMAKNTIRVFQYNIGHFAMGTASSTTISDQIPDGDETTPHSNYAVQLARWKSKIQNVAADIMFFEEYSTAFGTLNGASVPTASCGILADYPYLSVGTTTSTAYWLNAIISKYPLIGATKVDLGSPSGVSFKAFMQVASIQINDKIVKIAATHLNWNQSQAYHDSRILEMKNIIKYFEDDEYVIVCGDFNAEGEYGSHQSGDTDYTMDADEFDLFLYGFTDGGTTYAGGYTAANHGILGNLLTYPSTGGKPSRSPVPLRPLDNVLTKGFCMSNIVVVDDGNLTDHCGIMVDLTLV